MTTYRPAAVRPVLSVIVPAYNAEFTIKRLLKSLTMQTLGNFEAIVVDDGSSDQTADIVRSSPFKLIENDRNRGPAYCRNTGARSAKGDILVFTDSDCRVSPNWLQEVENQFRFHPTDAVMGKLELLPSNYIGDSISALGFPAGGSIGFDKIWRVDDQGYTDSLSTCNCAIRKDAFWKVGGFDETFPYAGGEDSFLAYSLRQKGYRIKFCRDVLVFHAARNSLKSFVTWQYKRGVSSFIFSGKIKSTTNFIALRLWSIRNIFRHFINDVKIPMIILLLLAGYGAQICGYLSARYNRSHLCTS